MQSMKKISKDDSSSMTNQTILLSSPFLTLWQSSGTCWVTRISGPLLFHDLCLGQTESSTEATQASLEAPMVIWNSQGVQGLSCTSVQTI